MGGNGPPYPSHDAHMPSRREGCYGAKVKVGEGEYVNNTCV